MHGFEFTHKRSADHFCSNNCLNYFYWLEALLARATCEKQVPKKADEIIFEFMRINIIIVVCMYIMLLLYSSA